MRLTGCCRLGLGNSHDPDPWDGDTRTWCERACDVSLCTGDTGVPERACLAPLVEQFLFRNSSPIRPKLARWASIENRIRDLVQTDEALWTPSGRLSATLGGCPLRGNVISESDREQSPGTEVTIAAHND